MALVATLPHERLDVSRVEIDRDGPSYTIETLRTLAADPDNIDTEFFFITGADALAACPPGVSTRRCSVSPPSLALLVRATISTRNCLPGRKIKFLPIPGIDVSSTMIRRRLAAGQSIDDLAPSERHHLHPQAEPVLRGNSMSRRLLVAIGLLVLVLVAVSIAVLMRSRHGRSQPTASPTALHLRRRSRTPCSWR